MNKKMTDKDLDLRAEELERLKIPRFRDGLYSILVNCLDQLPDNVVIEPGKNPLPGNRGSRYIGVYRQFHVFIDQPLSERRLLHLKQDF